MLRKMLATLALCFTVVLPVIAATPVNINKADAQTLAESLDGIGAGKAAAIVAYRKAHGPFKSIDELGNVKGIGAATVQRNHDAIRLSGDTAPAAARKASAPARHPHGH